MLHALVISITEAVVEASYFTEVCKEVLREPGFSCTFTGGVTNLLLEILKNWSFVSRWVRK